MVEIHRYAMTATGLPPDFGSAWLDEAAYGAALRALPISCVDVVPVHRDSTSLVIAERLLKPGAGPWMFGGRVGLGESLHDAAVRHVGLDLGLAIEAPRLKLLSVNQYLFDERQQPPQATPCHSICFVFALEVDAAELAAASAFVGPPEYAPGSLRRVAPPFASFGRRAAVFEDLHRACGF